MPRGRGKLHRRLSDLLPVTPICQTLQEAREAGMQSGRTGLFGFRQPRERQEMVLLCDPLRESGCWGMNSIRVCSALKDLQSGQNDCPGSSPRVTER